MILLAGARPVAARARRTLLSSRAGCCGCSCAAAALPFIANTTGWIFTEMGRQPWVVQGLLRTDDAVSPTVELRVRSCSRWSASRCSTACSPSIGGRLFCASATAGPRPPTRRRRRAAARPDLVLAY